METPEHTIISAHNRRAFMTVNNVEPGMNVANFIKLICSQAMEDIHAPNELKGLTYDNIWLSCNPDIGSELQADQPLELWYYEWTSLTFFYHLRNKCDCEAIPAVVDRMAEDHTMDSVENNQEELIYEVAEDVPEIVFKEEPVHEAEPEVEEENDVPEEDNHDSIDLNAEMDESPAPVVAIRIRNVKRFTSMSEVKLKEELMKFQHELDVNRTISINGSTYLLIVEGYPEDMSEIDIKDHLTDLFAQLQNAPSNPVWCVTKGVKGTVFLGITTRVLYTRLANTRIHGVPEYKTLYFYAIPMGKMPRMLRRTRNRANRN